MKKNSILKITISLLIIFSIINIFFLPKSNALGSILSKGQSFIYKADPIKDKIDSNALQNASGYIFNIFLYIAIIVAIAVGIFLGIKIMITSVEEKAKIKEAFIPYIVGCIVVFGSFTIWSIVVNLGNKAELGIQSGSAGDIYELGTEEQEIKEANDLLGIDYTVMTNDEIEKHNNNVILWIEKNTAIANPSGDLSSKISDMIKLRDELIKIEFEN